MELPTIKSTDNADEIRATMDAREKQHRSWMAGARALAKVLETQAPLVAYAAAADSGDSVAESEPAGPGTDARGEEWDAERAALDQCTTVAQVEGYRDNCNKDPHWTAAGRTRYGKLCDDRIKAIESGGSGDGETGVDWGIEQVAVDQLKTEKSVNRHREQTLPTLNSGDSRKFNAMCNRKIDEIKAG